MGRRGSAIAIAMLAAATPAAAENWRASSSTGPDAAAFIDTDSIRRSGDRVTFWREVRWAEPRTLPGGTRFDRVATHYEADCRAMTLQSMRMRALMGADAIFDDSERGEIERITEGTTAHTDLRAACFDEWSR